MLTFTMYTKYLSSKRWPLCKAIQDIRKIYVYVERIWVIFHNYLAESEHDASLPIMGSYDK